MDGQRLYGEPAAVEVARRDDTAIAVVTVRGEVDLRSYDQLRSVLANEVELGWNLIVDLSEVDLLDSTGLGLLVGILKRARERGERLGIAPTQLVLVVDTPEVRRTLELTRLDRVFTIADRLEDAESLI